MSFSRFLKRAFPLAVTLALGACSTVSGMLDDGPSPRVVDRGERLQCVPFAREESGVEIYGDAHTWWAKADGRYERESEPEEGAVMVLKGYKRSDRGHVAVVKSIESDREIVINHANWLNDGKIYLDQPVLDVSEDNDWTQVRVWYAPGGQYGARIYDVEGFILPHKLYAGAAKAGS